MPREAMMSPSLSQLDATAFANQFFHGQDRLRGSLPPELCAPTYEAEIVGFPPMDAAGHGQFGAAWYAAFPDITHSIDEARVTDTGIVVRFTAKGTHTAPFLGIPATNRRISASAFVLLTIHDGKVTRLRAIFDQMGLMRQLGVIPA
jgi:ketosteroid isomerase-like protein